MGTAFLVEATAEEVAVGDGVVQAVQGEGGFGLQGGLLGGCEEEQGYGELAVYSRRLERESGEGGRRFSSSRAACTWLDIPQLWLITRE